MSDELKLAAERMSRVFSAGSAVGVYLEPQWDECMEIGPVQLEDLMTIAHAYLDLRAEILLACLEESTYDGLYARLMDLHERGE